MNILVREALKRKTCNHLLLIKLSDEHLASKSFHHHHQSLNSEGRWGTTDVFATSFLHFSCSPLPSGTWSELQACPFPDVVFPPLPSVRLVFFPLSLCLAIWFWPDLMNGKLDHTIAVCVFLRSSGDLQVVQLPAGSWHGLTRW